MGRAWAANHWKLAARRRIQSLKTSLNLPVAPRVLEVGSYIGQFLHLGKAEGWILKALSLKNRQQLSREKTNAPVHISLIEEFLNKRPQLFDGVCLFHVLEHLADLVQVLRQIRSLMMDNGFLCLEVPNGDSCGEGDWSRFFNDDDTHLWFFSQRTLRAILNQAGFRVERIQIVPA